MGHLTGETARSSWSRLYQTGSCVPESVNLSGSWLKDFLSGARFDWTRSCNNQEQLQPNPAGASTAVLAERINHMFKHILCPTDLKERAELAVKKAVQIAHQFGSKITLLNIHSEFMDESEREMLRVSVNKIKEKYKQIAMTSKEEMKAVINRLHAEDIEVDYLLHKGSPEKTIVEVADKLGIDLIVICTDGRDNIKDFVAGTITEHIINAASCPVLVIPFKK
jgi:nucleotide-binding universal stress UspA family protein